MAGDNLSFSKVVATPTANAWSQAYSAGSLFAAVSLQSDIIPQEDENLNSLGKDVISTLESEFFPLEKKDLESIKGAVATTISKIKEDIKLSFVVCYLNDNILYLYAVGGGKAILKREDKIGTVIDSDEGREVKSASGYVQDKDYIVLETQPFLKTVATPTLASALDRETPEEVSEELAPHVHEKSEGGASAIILNYNEASSGVASEVSATAGAAAVVNQALNDSEEPEETEDKAENIESVEESSVVNEELNESINEIDKTPQVVEIPEALVPENLPQEKTPEQTSPYLTDQKSRRKIPGIGFGKLRGLTRRRRLLFLIGIILIVLILIAGFFLIFNRSSGDTDQFNQIYSEAQSKFEECQSLQELNASLAEEKCREAQQILTQNQNAFPEGSEEDNQIEALLVQVNNALGGSGSTEASSTATEVDKSESQLLSVQIDNPDSDFFTQNEDFIYFINGTGVTRLDKGNSEEEAIIDESWEEAGGIGVFGSNVYVLDKTDNILKFVPSGDTFSESNYITSDADLTKSVAMGIDGSIYVLDSSGNIQKYTKGAEEQFSVSGLEKSMSSPTRIVTGEDFENIYVLDNGNSRIVVLGKDGGFVKAYSADILKNARDIDPQEGQSAIFVLSSDKVFKIDLE